MMKLFFTVLTTYLFAQSPAINKETSTEGLRLPEKEELKPYVYEPVDLVYWAKAKELLLNKNYIELIYLGVENTNTFDPSSPEYAEGKLSIGIGLYHLGFSFAATKTFMELAKDRIGSHIGYSALDYLDRITQETPYDRLELTENFLNSHEFGDLPEKIQSFVSFHQAIYNSAFGFNKWSKPEYKKIHKFSFWHYQWAYLSALAHINQDNPTLALKLFRQIAENEEAPKAVSDKAKMQIARLIFEEGQFDKALELYNQLDLGIREKGRVLLERVWSMYYSKNYSESLGLLRALESPYFDASLNSEAYILQMVIYKQLCHYESVIETVDRFQQRFQSAFEAIEKRQDLETNATIARMALMEYDVQQEANFVDLIANEMERFQSYNWDDLDFYSQRLTDYENKIKEIKLRLKPILHSKSKQVAESILDAKEQVDFLDYSAKLDALRIVRKGENRNYTSERINYLKFDTIFWIFKGEFWLDELPNYRVLISSQCDKDNYKSKSDTDSENFEGEADF